MLDIIAEFALFLTTYKRLSNLSVSAYVSDVNIFASYFEFDLEKIKALNIYNFREWLAYRLENNYLPTSNERAIIAVKTFYKFLEKKYQITNKDVSKILLPKKPKRLPKAAEEGDIFELINRIKLKTDWETKRNKAIAYLLYATGMRISEVLGINRQDFNPKSDFIKIKGKGGKERLVPMISKVSLLILDYIKAYPKPILPNYPLFLGLKGGRYSVRIFQKDIANLRDGLSLPKWLTPHSFRHSFATHITYNGGDIKALQEVLGHSSLTTTQKYIKVSKKTMQSAYENFHPKQLLAVD
jgi:integrase/recombinase XerC